MPEGNFAIADETVVRDPLPTRTTKRAATKKKALTEPQLIALCQQAIEAEKAWNAAYMKISDMRAGEIPTGIRSEVERLSKRAASLQHQVIAVRPESLAGLKAKADAILAGYYDAPDDHQDLWSIVQDIATFLSAAARSSSGKLPAADREIMKLIQEFKYLEAECSKHDAIQEQYGERSREGRKAGRAIQKLVEREWEIRTRVADLHSVTPEGVAAKAYLAAWEASDGDIDGGPCEGSDERVAWSLAKDIVDGARPQMADIMAAQETAPHPDADLISLSRQYCDLERKSNDLFDGPNAVLDDDECEALNRPIKEAQKLLLGPMREQKATTLDGHLARIRAVVATGSILPDDPENMAQSNYFNEALLGMLLRDLAEQAGEIAQ
jgi:hypothetical protein